MEDEFIYDESPLADASIAVPLGMTRRIIFLSVGAVFVLIGFLSTALFQILSKTNNDLRQRGRYLVTGQGYTASVMVTIVVLYQGFRAWRLVTRYDRSLAIYEAPLSVPDDEDTMLDLQQMPSHFAASGMTNSISDSTASSNTAVTDSGDGTSAKVSTEQSPYYPPQLAAVVFVFVFSPALIYRVRNYKDGFGIRKDLMAVSAMGIPGIVLFVVVPMYAEQVSDKYLDRTTWMGTVLILSHIFAVILPLMRFVSGSSYRCAFEAAYASLKEAKERKRLRIACASTKAAEAEAAEATAEAEARGGGAGNSGHGGAQKASDPSTQRRIHDIALETMHPYHQVSGAGVGMSHHNNSNNNNQGNNRLQPSVDIAQRRPSRVAGSTNFSFWSRATDDDMRYDWDAFVKALDDPEVFDKISAFTVGEFCAENTRFLAELSRLEKRAQRFERLRSMTVTGGGSWVSLSTAAAVGGGGGAAAIGALAGVGTGGAGPTLHPNDSVQLYRFPPSDIEMGSTERIEAYDPNTAGGSKQRIKKIVSVSSVSSSMPMLGGASPYGRGRSSLSLDDFSEPPSPMGMPPVIRAPVAMTTIASTTTLGGIRSNATLDSLRTTLPTSDEAAGEELIEDEEEEEESRTLHNAASLTTSEKAATRPPFVPRGSTSGAGAMSLAETVMAPLPMPPTLLIQFQNIYKTFIRHGGRLELNLSHDTFTEIAGMAKRGEWRADMFEK
ncbi:hypothetical protein DFQ27_004061 [Actinomortierella ambigua]|uniref:RGS domain-containing protein n=1 Tax=Actinomortierella ambigua TaxID=1343610 RepID=A0A9P6Q2X0_9FUNG|nr:hypothetical protein DFQ27_004061 [Actinomortierella ambigua]